MLYDRILYYNYFAEVARKLRAEVGATYSLKLHFLRCTRDENNLPKTETIAEFEVLPENEEQIDKYFKEYVYTEENFSKSRREYQCTHSVGCAIPPDKAPIYQKIVNDYLI